MKKNTEFLYSVGLAGFALLNQDGSVPFIHDWEDVDNSGVKRTHSGGIIGKAGPYDLSSNTDTDFMDIFIGNKLITRCPFNPNTKKVSAQNVATHLNENHFKYAKEKGFDLKADTINIDGKDHIRITNPDKKIPFYTPVGLHGLCAQILGIQGFLFTDEMKSVKSDFEKESGKSVDVTSGRGIRCVVKEADKIKGLNLTISMAGFDPNIMSIITGHKYNVKEDAFFIETENKTPSFAFVYFVKAFAKGENNESSFEKVKAVVYPSCQATLPGESAQEGAFATMELQASCSANRKSNLPMMFYKGVSLKDYSSFVEII